MGSTELYLVVNYFASYFPAVIVGVALVVLTCGISAAGTRHADRQEQVKSSGIA